MATRYGSRSLAGEQVSQWLNPQTLAIMNYTRPRGQQSDDKTVTADVSAHTYGAWTELIASLPANTSLLQISVRNIAATTVNTASVLSIGVGPSGSEAELFYAAVGSAVNLSANVPANLNFVVPVKLTAGTRVAARLQSLVTGGKTASVSTFTCDSDPLTFTRQPANFDSLGVNLSTSEGTSIAANDAYSEITSSTTSPYRGLVLIPSAASSTMGAFNGTMTVAVGALGSELDVGSVGFQSSATEFLASPINFFVPFNIPIGSRISVKQSGNNTQIDASVIGVI
jgi:hypothetical protein